ncbi:MAG: hypothetical protein A2X80_13970 [Geobacteraceae bacterium GWB2_52_12]|nr:MAG: hypothetical protein A2X80_13970 [Geobacteraceae bacterium GWB2_52_12]
MSKPMTPDSGSCPQETGNGSPGSILRRCREFHGHTLEEASETTKIGISHLKALEDDRIREFANQAYLKGFLRIYATYLGLNSADIARMYDKLFGGQDEKPDTISASSSSFRPKRRLIVLKKLVLPALLLTLILVTATFFKRPPSPPAQQPQPAVITPPPVQEIAVQMVQSSARIKKKEPELPILKSEKRSAESPPVEKAIPMNGSADAANGFILRIKVTQNGTLTATVDGSMPQSYVLAIGDVIEWKAEKKVALELSNAGGIDIELNGKPYKSLGSFGKPAYIELDAEGVKR